MMNEEHKKKWFKFDSTISLGNVLTIFILVIGGWSWATGVEKVLAVHETRLNASDKIHEMLDKADTNARREIGETLREMRDDMREIRRTHTELVKAVRK